MRDDTGPGPAGMSDEAQKGVCVTRTYCSRAKLRLRIAGRLLRWRGVGWDEVVDRGCGEVLAIIERLSVEHRRALKEHVDWVEAFESEETSARRRD
jgi:hypothetical protein